MSFSNDELKQRIDRDSIGKSENRKIQKNRNIRNNRNNQNNQNIQKIRNPQIFFRKIYFFRQKVVYLLPTILFKPNG